MSYKCEGCKNNNNGWCKEKKMNGLKKLNLQECEHYGVLGTEVLFERGSKDFYGQEHIAITINGQVASFPMSILKDFLEKEAITSLSFTIPD